jgi:hypothetical protein
MLRLVSDAGFRGRIVRGLFHKEPALDLVRAEDVGLRTGDDPTILAWAAANERIVLTQDEKTFSRFAYARVAAGQSMTGVIVAPQSLPIGKAIEEILIAVHCSEQWEWENRVEWLPF